jgi:putative proteasome-type protease
MGSSDKHAMTFCLGMKVAGGLVGLADTRIVMGSERTSKAKVSQLPHPAGPLFLMTSGLRSIRDKASIYFEQSLAAVDDEELPKMFQAANLFGTALRRVRKEDGPSLAKSRLTFNLNAILGGQLADDPEPQLFYVYPEGNWVQATADSPYHIIGRRYYGRPILDRLLTSESSLGQAVALAYLAFDGTRASVTDVDFPIDIVVLDAATGRLQEHRFDEDAVEHARQWWQRTLHATLAEFPLEWAQEVLGNAD